MPEAFYLPGLLIAVAGGLIGTFLARDFNIPYYLIILAGIILTGLGIPLLQLAGGVAIAIAISRMTSNFVQEVS